MNKAGRSTIKFFLYIFGKIIAAAAAIAVVFLAFLTALNTLSVSVMVKDAFTKRASAIMSPVDNDDVDILPKVFTEAYLVESGLGQKNGNENYKVNSYSQITNVELGIVLPWETSKTMYVEDVIGNVKASIINDAAVREDPKESLIDSGYYEVMLEKQEDGTWLVDDLVKIEDREPEKVVPLPTPAPMASEEVVEEDTTEAESAPEETTDSEA